MSAMGRRDFLKASAGVGAAFSACPFASQQARAEDHPVANPGTDGVPDVPPTGEHQPGIVDEIVPEMELLSVSIQPGGDLRHVLWTVSDLARSLATGRRVQQRGVSRPADDNGTLGSPTAVDGVRMTVGFGASLFDDRFDLKNKKPKHLSAMSAFPDDTLEPDWCHGDISIQIGANHEDAVLHAVRLLLQRLRGHIVVNWRIRGYVNPPRPSGTPRNHLGFMDGTVQPQIHDPATAKRLLWAGDDEPAWCKGGTYQVIRVIRMLVEFWDRITISEQENIFGRDRLTGAPLSGGDEHSDPDYHNDPTGAVIPLNSHIRLANPRTPEVADSMILRRGFNYNLGVADNGTLDMGIIFTCYQQDIERQFATMQRRLEGEPLADYIIPFGGGYFFVPGGMSDDPSDYLGRKLLEN